MDMIKYYLLRYSKILIGVCGFFFVFSLLTFPYGKLKEAVKGPEDIKSISITDIHDDKVYYFDHLVIIGSYAKVVDSPRAYYIGMFQDGEGKQWFISVDPQIETEIKEELEAFFDDPGNILNEYDLSGCFSLVSLNSLKTRYRAGLSIDLNQYHPSLDEDSNGFAMTAAVENIDTFFQDACDIYKLFYSAEALYYNADYITTGEYHTLSKFCFDYGGNLIVVCVSFTLLVVCIILLLSSKSRKCKYSDGHYQGAYSQNKANRKSGVPNSKRCRPFRRKNNKTSPNSCFNDWPNNKKAASPAIALADDLFHEFCEKGLTQYLTVDYCGPDHTSFHLYSMNGKIVFSQDAHRELHLIYVNIMKHLNLPPFVNLIIQDDSGTIIDDKSKAQERSITVKIKEYFQPSNIVAILCHECAHYFMEYHGLNMEDKHINEPRTDVVANLIGFNKIMSYGYRPIVTEQINGNIRTTTTHKIGYISDTDCVEIGKFLKVHRGEIKSIQAAAQKNGELKSQCRKLLETAKIFAQQLESIDFNTVNSSTYEHTVKIQQVLLEKESINIETEIQKHEQSINKCTDTMQLEREKAALDQLCMTFLTWLKELQDQ